MNKIRKLLLAALVLLWLPLATLGGTNTWTGTAPLATGLGNQIINALAVTPDGLTVYAGNGSGTVLSYDIVPPSVTTGAAGSVTAVGAILNGTVNANGVSSSTLFRYGISSGSLTSNVVATPGTATGSSATAISASLSGLTPNTTYYFRAEATGAGTAQGIELTFDTLKLAPTAVSAAATSVTGTTATLNGTVNAQHDSTAITFEYGLTTGYGSTVTLTSSSTYADTAVSTGLTGLVPNTTYHFRVKAVNSTGTTVGFDQSFTTSVAAPVVTTGTASSVAASSATLNGMVNANNASTAVTFDYGTSTSYGSTATAAPSPVTGVADTSVSAALTGLTANTTYHFRVVGGSSNGSDQTFTTLLATPVATTASAITLTGFTANWAAVTGATGYELDVATDSAFASLVSGYSNKDVGNVTSFAVTGLTTGTPYFYRVRAVSASNHSDNSNTISTVTGSSKLVTNTNDSGAGSLRQVIVDAVAGDIISFASDVQGSITLASALVIDKDLSIIGPGAALLTISGNNAVQIFNVTTASSFTLQNLSLANGSSSSGGGAVQAVGAISTNISGCVFSGNTSTGNGGAIFTANGVMNISDSLFSGNSATSPSSGGALAAMSGTLTIGNSTFTGNSAGSGGAIFGQFLTTVFTNLSVSNNSAALQGGGVSIAGVSTATLKNTLIANNTAPTGVDMRAVVVGGAVTSLGYNLIGSTSNSGFASISSDITGTDAARVDSRLGTLANNGGPTQTMALLAGSPAIDTGTCTGAPATDQRGMARPQNTLCDIGAFERGVPATLVATGGTPQSTLVSTAFTSALTAKVTDSLGMPLDGIGVTFTGPASGASITVGGSASTSSTGIASLNVAANAVGASYTVAANVNALTASFSLTNTVPADFSNADLSALALSSGSLAPAFASSTRNYSVSVPNNVAFMSVTPTVDNAAVTVKVNASSVVSGTASGNIVLAVGSNTIVVLVTAQDGISTQTYTLTVNRMAVITSYTAPSPTGTGNITASISGGGAGCGFSMPQFIAVAASAGAPSVPTGLGFTHGLFDFATTAQCTGTVTVTIMYPQTLASGTKYWKYGPTRANQAYHWYEMPSTVVDRTVTFSMTDGQDGDDDLLPNGTIVDAGGAGALTAPSGAANIPALSEWGLVLLSSLMALMAVGQVRTRRIRVH